MCKKKTTAVQPSSSQTSAPCKGGWIGCLFVLLLRCILFVVMLSFLAGAVLWLVASHLFNAQQLSEAITRQLQLVFNRPVVISSIDLKFFNTVELKGFSILDSEVMHGMPVVSAESVIIRYQLWPLLEHKLIIDEVTLNKPRIDIVRSPEGRYNVPPVRASKMPHTYENKSTGKSMQIMLNDWSIREGVISYRDQASGAAHAVYGLNMHFTQLHLNKWSKFRLETVLRNQWNNTISDLEIRGRGQINLANFNWEQFGLRNFKTQVAVFRKPVQMTWQLENLRRPKFSVEAKAPAFDQQNLSMFVNDLPEFSVPASTVNVSGSIDETYTHFKFSKLTAKTDVTTVTGSGTIDLSAAPFEVDLKLKSNWTDLAQLSKHWPQLTRFSLQGKGSASANILRQKGKYNLPTVELNVKNASGNFWGFNASEITGQFIAKQDFTDLYAQTTSGTVQVANSKFEKLNLSGSYRKGNVYAYIASALLNEVPLKLRLSIDQIKRQTRTIDTSIYLQNFDPMKFIGVVMDFVEVISAIPKNPKQSTELQTGELAWMRNFRDRLPEFMPNFSGTLYGDTFSSTVLSGKNFNAEFDFTGLLPGGASLDGTLDMKLEDGTIHQMEKVAEEQQALGVTYTPFIMLHRMESSGSFKVGEVLKDVAFDEMAASVDFKKGTMIINNAFTQGPVISAAVSGWTDWVRETLELDIWTMITPSSRRGILAENLTDENGNPALAFKVFSSMLKPKVEMLRAKKTNTQIQTAQKRGLRTDFTKSREFLKGDFHAKK